MVRQIQDLGLGRDTFSQRHFHGDQHGLIVMLKACLGHDVMQNQRQNIDHLPVTTGTTQHQVLQRLDGRRDFRTGGSVSQSTGLALKGGRKLRQS